MRLRALPILAASISIAVSAQPPVPLPGNPGNIFTLGQDVSVVLPQHDSNRWKAVNFDGKVIAQGEATSGRADLGKLPIGFYSVQTIGSSKQTTLGVVSPLSVPTPPNSPIATDGALAWFYKTADQWRAASSLATLAGVNWVRDRYSWGEMEPIRGQFVSHSKYDDVTEIERQAGLHVLDVSGSAPSWTGSEAHRFPPDLRDAFEFYRAIAQRWKGKVDAVEAWNEPDFANAGAEIASFQKAAYLGLKAGNPSILVCSQPWAVPEVPVVQEFSTNDVWPYFDTFNFHHYQTPQELPNLYATHRVNENGKPVWISEFNLPVSWSGDPTVQDPTSGDLHVQAQRVPKMFAVTLSQGVQMAYYFTLGNYTEGNRQYGLLHQDLTPRPAYLALAAVGRLLAGATPYGQLTGVTTSVGGSGVASVFAFRANPDGDRRDVLIAWADNGHANLYLPVSPVGEYDTIGRQVPLGPTPETIPLGGSPVFVVLPDDTVQSWLSNQFKTPSKPVESFSNLTQHQPTLIPPAASQPPPFTAEPPSSIVLQALFDSTQLVKGAPMLKYSAQPTNSDAMRIQMPPHQQIQIFAYNFGSQTKVVTLQVQVPNGWRYSLPITSVSVPANGRVSIPFDVTPDASSEVAPETVTIRASGVEVGDSVVSFRLLP